MDAATDFLTAAKAVVERYLELSMVPDPVGAAAYVAEAFELIFTGGRRFFARPRARPSTPGATPG